MFKLEVENQIGERLTLTGREGDYQVFNIDGLNPPQAQINTAGIAGMDGERFNSSKLNMRNVVLYVRINGDVAANRLRLYQMFPTKQWCKIFYDNGSRNVFIEGYVETHEVTSFSNDETAQISIVCPYPYFKGVQEIVDDISKIVALFKFPFSINIDEPIPFSDLVLQKVTNVINHSESEAGLIISANFHGEVNTFEIRNTITGESLILDYEFQDMDRVVIDCNRGNKSVKLTRSAKEYNLIPYMQKGATFFQLKTGDNFFSYLATNVEEGDSDHLVELKFKHHNVYRGV